MRSLTTQVEPPAKAAAAMPENANVLGGAAFCHTCSVPAPAIAAVTVTVVKRKMGMM